MNEQWIQQLRQIMDGYQRPAPEVSWDEIDKVLSLRKADRTRRLWLHSMAAAALLLLIAGVLEFHGSSNGTNAPNHCIG